ncbi:MAG: hypothetical protein GY941_01415 [Planctomycetes bacterium]|nr:hypothetical protein [Planctomycetota bacterium]
MAKKKALGGDPLSWLKGKYSEEKEEINSVDQEPQTEKPIATPTPVSSQAEEEEFVQSEYDGNSDKACETRSTTRKRRRIVIDDHEPVYQTSVRTPKQKENPATIFVVVYTVLLLILGFLVFRDMTKKISNLEAKITHLEKQLESDYIRYEDTDF